MSAQLDDITIKVAGSSLDLHDTVPLISFKIAFSQGTSAIAQLVFQEDEKNTLQSNSSLDIGKEIEVILKKNEKDYTLFKGDITRVDYILNAKEAHRVKIICYDGMYKLARIYKTRAFLSTKISDIASTMAGEAGLSTDITATTTSHDHLYQNNQSNLDFLKMHAKRLGYEINVIEKKLYFKKAAYETKTDSTATLEWGENILEFSAKIDASDVLVEVTVDSWDSANKKNIEYVAQAGSETTVGGNKTVGTTKVKKSFSNAAKVFKLDIPDLDSAEATAVAKAHLTNASLNFLQCEGICEGEPAFKIGEFINVKGVGDKLSGSYYITGYEHIFNSNGFKTAFEIKSNGAFK